MSFDSWLLMQLCFVFHILRVIGTAKMQNQNKRITTFGQEGARLCEVISFQNSLELRPLLIESYFWGFEQSKSECPSWSVRSKIGLTYVRVNYINLVMNILGIQLNCFAQFCSHFPKWIWRMNLVWKLCFWLGYIFFILLYIP